MSICPEVVERVERLEMQLKNAQRAITTAYMQTPEGQATWLDRCAWAAMQGLVTANAGVGVSHFNDVTPEAYSLIAKGAYKVADAMLAEKRRREGGAASVVANPDGTVILRPGTWSVNGKIIVVPEGESKAVSLNTGSAGGAS